MRAQGMTNAMISLKAGISTNAILCRLNPETYERQKAANKARYVPKPYKPRNRANEVHDTPEPAHLCRPIEEYMLDWQRVKVEGAPPPPDTRDNTGRLLGDPLPGRRALDKVRSGARA